MELNILVYGEMLKRRMHDGKPQVWDILRSKWIALTPEEMVRMCFVHYLIHQKKVSRNKIAIEREILVGAIKKRFDVLVYDENLHPFLAVECKSPDVGLNEKVISQLVRYNQALECEYLWVVNGVESRGYKKKEDGYWRAMEGIPF